MKNSATSFDITPHLFQSASLEKIQEQWYASGFWPVVYLLNDNKEKSPAAYVGETTDIVSRLSNHLRHPHKQQLTHAYLISSDIFNKSATLDLESELIKYLSADEKYTLLNANLGLANHNYYQKEKIYQSIFAAVWDKLIKMGIAQHSLQHINNSDIFKYSPYKSLSQDQVKGLILILKSLQHDTQRNTVIEGTAGTGKSILAVYLFKLLNTPLRDFRFADFGPEEQEVYDLVKQLKDRYPEPRMALVIPMEPFRKTVQKIFKHVKGLRANMVISPSELSKKRFDIVVVDEAHRLKRRIGLSQYGAFDQTSKKLGFDKHIQSELDWVLKQSDKTIFFYDEFQSIKPSDIPAESFDRLKNLPETKFEYLNAQMRVRGGIAYVNFLRRLLFKDPAAPPEGKITLKKYDLRLFTDLGQLIEHIKAKNSQEELARMVAGFAWPWVSKKNPKADDIQIGSLRLKWNSKNIDWPNSPNAINEVGCIHTIQGYDLNYTGVVFGPEIGYNKEKKEIIVRRENYHDRNGKATIKSPDILKRYILHIYQTLMLRGIHGTYLYVCDEALRDYFAQYIPVYGTDNASGSSREGTPPQHIHYQNSVPMYYLTAAAGSFSEQQQVTEKTYIPVPNGIRITSRHFACRVVGESMNKIIPNGSICLFKQYSGGARNGLIVLAEHTDLQDTNNGSYYTVKEYHSIKKYAEDGSWTHESIRLLPRSTDSSYKPIVLHGDEAGQLHVAGIFECVLYDH